MVLFEMLYPCRHNAKLIDCRGTRLIHFALASVLHRKIPPDGGISDKLAINRLANGTAQPDSSLHFHYANAFFAVWIQPVAVRWCYLK